MNGVNLSLCEQCTVPVEKCNNKLCFCFWNRNRKKKKQKKQEEKNEDDEISMTVLNAPMVKVNLTPEEIDKSDFYVFDENLNYLVVQGSNIHGKYMDPKKVVGKKIDECDLPPNIAQFFRNLYKNTLDDGHYQITIFMDDKTYLLNTYPIKNEDQNVVGGLLTCRHSSPLLNDLKMFELIPENKKP